MDQATSENDFYDKLLEGDLVPGLDNAEVLHAINKLESTTARKELNKGDTTPTPSRKPRGRDRDTTPTLQLPTRLRVNVTPTKKAPLEMVKAFEARKRRFEAGQTGTDGNTSIVRSGSVPLPVTGPNLGQGDHAEVVRYS